jgi:hypothetical protein
LGIGGDARYGGRRRRQAEGVATEMSGFGGVVGVDARGGKGVGCVTRCTLAAWSRG